MTLGLGIFSFIYATLDEHSSQFFEELTTWRGVEGGGADLVLGRLWSL